MGLFCYILAEDPRTAEELFDAPDGIFEFTKDKNYSVVEAPGMLDNRLQELFKIVSDKPRKFQLIKTNADDSQWLLRIPNEFVDKVAALPKGQLKRIAKEWWDTEPVRFREHIHQRDMEKGLRILVDIMVAAKQRKKPVFLCISL